ncbi:MAG: hypothetical protein ABSD96_21285 [Candidatus Korobacteraceae bacterium]|jgi:hypothetical protein
MHNLRRIGFAGAYVFLDLVILYQPLPTLASAPSATGHFEVYCDGVGLFLAKIDGAPASGKLVFFSYMGFPGGTFGGKFVGQGKWSDVYVYRDGCVPDGKCENIADGKVWIDTTDEQDKQLKRISGKSEINLNGKHLEGTFLAKRHDRRRPLRLCM